MIYRFDSFELDGPQYRLTRDLAAVKIKPKILELLLYLIEHRDRVVPKAELVSAVWEGRFVSDSVVKEAVYQARRTLGDRGPRARFIKTLHARGYQSHYRPVEVVTTDEHARAKVALSAYLFWMGGSAKLARGETVIGRDAECDIVLDSPRASRRHARVVVSGSQSFILEDLGSKNGSLLNGATIASPTPLSEGDVIEIGGVAMTFRRMRDNLSTVTTSARLADPRLGTSQAPPASPNDEVGATMTPKVRLWLGRPR